VDEGKLSLESKDIAAEKRQELLRLFPEAQTEGGKIDFDQLKRALGESVDAGRERYVFDVSQTDGVELPNLHEVSGDSGENIERWGPRSFPWHPACL
jgi:hypothetical protein